MSASKDLKGEWYWICGGTSGIGLAVAEKLASRGASLVLMSRSVDKLEAAATKLSKLGAGDVRLAALDISSPDTPNIIPSHLNGVTLSGILLNGGGPAPKPVGESSWDDMEAAHRLLFCGPTQCLLALLPFCARHDKGGNGCGVVAITSITVKEPVNGLSLSAAYRTGLVAWLKNLSNEIGSQGIRINTVAPGYTETERLVEVLDNTALQEHSTAEVARRRMTEGLPLKRMGQPAEIAAACVFLLSSESTYITGQTLLVDGGQIRGY